MSYTVRAPLLDTTKKNHRLTIEAGTKIANMIVAPEHGLWPEPEDRLATQQAAAQAVVRLYEENFGPVEWDMATMQFSHVTVGCSVELRVAPPFRG